MKRALITGASQGIGLASAELLLAEGYEVVGLDRLPGGLEHRHYRHHRLDLTELDAVAAVVKAIPQIDLLLNNAGIHRSASLADTSEALFDEVIGINLKAPFFLSQYCLPALKAARGSIVFIGSDQSLVGKRGSAAYGLSKGAIGQLTKSLALDLAADGVRVNCICAGTIDTPLYQHAIARYCQQSGREPAEVHAEEAALQPLNRLGSARDVAELVAFLASPRAAFMTGSLVSLDGGYTAQ
ncbi:SDR family NAD(P)-dependent oxidoreductase [Gallaecimonas sp. GXIMD4217]|uniref:SDR family NAD(P)-dependent oxidoreductase n=1 Tax=Gallaecimonas sp. GXIMD4217 TaxID=3131927 RepID=UPI00311AFF85